MKDCTHSNDEPHRVVVSIYRVDGFLTAHKWCCCELMAEAWLRSRRKGGVTATKSDLEEK
jgi:hypothetical protein